MLLMDLIFNCPKCNQELEVDASGAGQEIECPSCEAKIEIPDPNAPGVRLSEGGPAAAGGPVNAMAASAAAKVEMHLKVPVRTSKTARC